MVGRRKMKCCVVLCLVVIMIEVSLHDGLVFVQTI